MGQVWCGVCGCYKSVLVCLYFVHPDQQDEQVSGLEIVHGYSFAVAWFSGGRRVLCYRFVRSGHLEYWVMCYFSSQAEHGILKTHSLSISNILLVYYVLCSNLLHLV